MNRWEVGTDIFKLGTKKEKSDHLSLQGPTSVLGNEISSTGFHVLKSNILFSKKKPIE